MRVLVTGGSGFTGRRVLQAAVAAGHDVLALARSQVAADIVTSCGGVAVQGDLDDAESIDRAFSVGADALINVASLGFGHADGVVSAAERAGITRAVFVSTTAVTTRLAVPSKAVRLAAEETIRASALEWTVLRPTMIYGAPGDRNLSRLLAFLRRSSIVPIPGRGDGLQQPVHVDDLATAIVTAVTSPIAIGRTYDLAGPEALPFSALVRTAASAVGRRPRLVKVPVAPVLGLLRAYEATGRSPRISSEQVLRLQEDKAFSIAPATEDLGYFPRSFEEGIRAEARALFG